MLSVYLLVDWLFVRREDGAATEQGRAKLLAGELCVFEDKAGQPALIVT